MMYLLLLALCTALTLIGVLSVWRVTAAGDPREAGRPETAVTVLKPLRGADDDLEANLETFFLQDYPRYDLLFGVEGQEDPALAVVRRLLGRYPKVRARVVVHRGGRGLNPKVSNLRAMMEAGTRDVVVVSDSNVAVAPDYLRRMVACLNGPRVGLVSHLFRGVGERSLGATLENLHLNGPVAAGVAAAQEIRGRSVAVGKSMMFRRSALDALGGMESLASVLAEDYVLTRMFRSAGYTVRICRGAPVDNVARSTSVRAFLARHLRWGLLRSRLQPLAYPLEFLAYPVAIALLAPVFGVVARWPMLWATGLTLLRDGLQWWRLRGRDGLLRAVPIGLVKDLLCLALWAIAPWLRRAAWRGHRCRVSFGTILYAEGRILAGPLPREASMPTSGGSSRGR